MCAPWPIMMCMCVMTHSYVRHDSCIRAPWPSDIYSMTPAYVPWLIHIQWYVSRRTRTRWYRTLINTTQTNKVTKSKRNPFSAASHQSLWRAGLDPPHTNTHYPRNHLSSSFTISFCVFPKVSFRVPPPLPFFLSRAIYTKQNSQNFERLSTLAILFPLLAFPVVCACACACVASMSSIQGALAFVCVCEKVNTYLRVFSWLDMFVGVRVCVLVCVCIHERAMACIRMLCVTHMNESWVMIHTSLRQVVHL